MNECLSARCAWLNALAHVRAWTHPCPWYADSFQTKLPAAGIPLKACQVLADNHLAVLCAIIQRLALCSTL